MLTTMLTKRRAVDHCRMRSSLCRMSWPRAAPLPQRPDCRPARALTARPTASSAGSHHFGAWRARRPTCARRSPT